MDSALSPSKLEEYIMKKIHTIIIGRINKKDDTLPRDIMKFANQVNNLVKGQLDSNKYSN